MRILLVLFLLNFSMFALDIRDNGKIYNNVEIIKVTDSGVVTIKDASGNTINILQKKSNPESVSKNKNVEQNQNESSWLTDYETAISEAKKNNKPVLADFTGSDWCKFCILLDSKVFNTKEFKNFAEKKVVLFKADFPSHKQLPENEKKQNEQLRNKFKITGFPTILLINPQTEEILATKTGYREDSATNYISELDNVVRKYNRQNKSR